MFRYEFLRYRDGHVAIQVWQGEEPYATATVWVEGLQSGEVAIKDYSENTGMLERLLHDGIVRQPHRSVFSGFVRIPVCYLTTKGKKEVKNAL